MKAIINIDNYEAFWVDYLDGKLSETDEERLFDFLESNPEISANLIDTDDFMLTAPDVKYPAKSSLKAEFQIDNLLIAKIENQISDEDDKFIIGKIQSNAKIASTYSLYKKTILKTDKSVVFPGKKYLKKTVKIAWYGYASAIAAAFAVVFVTGWFISGTRLEVNSGVKSQYSEISLPERLIDTVSNFDNQLQNAGNQIVNPMFSNNFTENAPVIQNSIAQPSDILNMVKREAVPQRIPIASLSVKEVKQIDEYVFMEYRDDIPEEQTGFEYSMQYIKTPKENKIKSTINKVIDFSKELDIKGSYEKLKLAKEDLLFTSNN
jgi:hypothetical protein